MKRLNETFGTSYFGQGPFGGSAASSTPGPEPGPEQQNSDDVVLMNSGAMGWKRSKRGRKRADDSEVMAMALSILQRL